MLFELAANLQKLVIYLRHRLVERLDWPRRPNPRDDVLALRVHEVFAVKGILAGGRISSEGDAGSGVLAHIPKDHGLNVDRRSQKALYVVELAIFDGSLVVPASDDGIDCASELVDRPNREFLAGVFFVDFQIILDQLFEVLGGKLHIEIDAAFVLFGLNGLLELLVRDAHHDVAEHVDEPAIRIPCEADVARSARQSLHGIGVKAEVEHGVHHPRHRDGCARSDRYQKRIVAVAEFFAHGLFELRQIFFDVVP